MVPQIEQNAGSGPSSGTPKEWVERMGRRLKLRDLHVLLAVAECKSMTKAAQRLSVTVPVVSKTVAELEATLGVSLFDRSSVGVEPTAYGDALLRCGVAVFHEMRQGLLNVRHLSDPHSGELRIGCPEIIVAGVLPPIVEEFVRRYPRVQLHLSHEETGTGQFRHLRSRNVELFIARLAGPLFDEDLSTEDLFDEPFTVYAGLDSPFARRRRLPLSDLMGEHWVLPPYDSVPGTVIAGIFGSFGLTPPLPTVETYSAHLSAALVGTGKFVGMLPRSVLHFHAKRMSVKALPVALPERRFKVVIVRLKNRSLSPLAQLFVECARQMVGHLPGPA